MSSTFKLKKGEKYLYVNFLYGTIFLFKLSFVARSYDEMFGGETTILYYEKGLIKKEDCMVTSISDWDEIERMDDGMCISDYVYIIKWDMELFKKIVRRFFYKKSNRWLLDEREKLYELYKKFCLFLKNEKRIREGKWYNLREI